VPQEKTNAIPYQHVTGALPAARISRAELKEISNMTNNSPGTSLATSVIRDDGVQRAAAGLVISLVVAVAKKFLFPGA
jgi:hypothetical protein